MRASIVGKPAPLRRKAIHQGNPGAAHSRKKAPIHGFLRRNFRSSPAQRSTSAAHHHLVSTELAWVLYRRIQGLPYGAEQHPTFFQKNRYCAAERPVRRIANRIRVSRKTEVLKKLRFEPEIPFSPPAKMHFCIFSHSQSLTRVQFQPQKLRDYCIIHATPFQKFIYRYIQGGINFA